MREVSIEKAKEVIIEPSPVDLDGRSRNMLNFTRLCMEAEVQTIQEIDSIGRGSHDLVHLSGVHKFRYSPMKADELRYYWTVWWQHDNLIRKVDGLRSYIIDVLEASAYRAGKSRRAFGLFLGCSGFDNDESGHLRRPWRTAEWYAERRAARPVFKPLTEFYPYVTTENDQEHEFLLAIEKLVPKSLPNWARADICQDMIVAVLTGEATLDNIRDAVPRYIKWFFAKEPSKYGDLSLDAPMRNSSFKGSRQVMTLGESIAAEFA